MRRLEDGRPKLNFNNSFFKIFRDKDAITVSEVYTLCERRPDGNRFLQNALAGWKKKGLIEPIYKINSYPSPVARTLEGIKLTALGKSYFHRAACQASKTLTVDELLHIVTDFKKQHPDIVITFELHAKRMADA